MSTQNLLSVNDLTKEQSLDLITTAKYMAAISEGPNRKLPTLDRKSTRLNSSHSQQSRMPSSA